MKRSLLIFFSFLLLLASSCRRGDEVVLFTDDYNLSFSVPPGISPFATTYVTLPSVPCSFVAARTSAGVAAAEIAAVRPAAIVVESDYVTDKWDFAEEVSVLINNGGGDLEVGFSTNIPTNAGFRLDLAPTLVDAAAMLSGGSFNVKVRVRPRYAPAFVIPARVFIRFAAVR